MAVPNPPGMDALVNQVKEIVDLLKGDPGSGRLSYEMVLGHVSDVAPKVNTTVNGLEEVKQRVLNVEQTLEPVLKQAYEEINKLKDQSQNIQQVIDRELTTLKNTAQQTQDALIQELQSQSVKHDSLIQHSQTKFQELEASQQLLMDAAKHKFEELNGLRVNFETQVAVKVQELDAKMIQVNQLFSQAAGQTAAGNTGGAGGAHTNSYIDHQHLLPTG